MGKDAVVVAVRSRPINDNEKKRGKGSTLAFRHGKTVLFSDPEDTTGKEKPREFHFDFAFNSTDPDSKDFCSQETVYNALGNGLLEQAFSGYNACLFAYGQTGSGKTFSMMGVRDNPDLRGVTPRLCSDLFNRIATKSAEDAAIEFKVEVQYFEIYMERVKCLFNPKKENLKVREHPTTGPYVENLTSMLATGCEDLMKLLEEGNKVRTVAATLMNDASSRSHAIFSITLTQIHTFYDKEQDKEIISQKLSKINLVDLAGSERAEKTGATGDRLQEGSAINKSLTNLGIVINALAKAGGKAPGLAFVPYRDSVLTWILKENLGGNSKTFMISTLSPAAYNYNETLSTLRYADRAKHIQTKAVINENSKDALILDLKSELEALKTQLLERQNKLQDNLMTPRASEAENQQVVDLQSKLLQHEKLMAEANMSWEEKMKRTEREQQERQGLVKDLETQLDQLRLEQVMKEQAYEDQLATQRQEHEAALHQFQKEKEEVERLRRMDSFKQEQGTLELREHRERSEIMSEETERFLTVYNEASKILSEVQSMTAAQEQQKVYSLILTETTDRSTISEEENTSWFNLRDKWMHDLSSIAAEQQLKEKAKQQEVESQLQYLKLRELLHQAELSEHSIRASILSEETQGFLSISTALSDASKSDSKFRQARVNIVLEEGSARASLKEQQNDDHKLIQSEFSKWVAAVEDEFKAQLKKQAEDSQQQLQRLSEQRLAQEIDIQIKLDSKELFLVESEGRNRLFSEEAVLFLTSITNVADQQFKALQSGQQRKMEQDTLQLQITETDQRTTITVEEVEAWKTVNADWMQAQRQKHEEERLQQEAKHKKQQEEVLAKMRQVERHATMAGFTHEISFQEYQTRARIESEQEGEWMKLEREMEDNLKAIQSERHGHKFEQVYQLLVLETDSRQLITTTENQYWSVVRLKHKSFKQLQKVQQDEMNNRKTMTLQEEDSWATLWSNLKMVKAMTTPRVVVDEVESPRFHGSPPNIPSLALLPRGQTPRTPHSATMEIANRILELVMLESNDRNRINLEEMSTIQHILMAFMSNMMAIRTASSNGKLDNDEESRRAILQQQEDIEWAAILAKLEGMTEGIDARVMEMEVWENQRWLPMKGWGEKWLGSDRPALSTSQGESSGWPDLYKETYRSKNFWKSSWSVDVGAQFGEHGWQYALNWNSYFSSQARSRYVVRRRRWFRQCGPKVMSRTRALTEASPVPLLPITGFANVYHHGVLFKRGKVNTKFQKRAFTLSGGTLSYAGTGAPTDFKGSIPLKGAAIIEGLATSFAITGPSCKRRYDLQAEAIDDKDMWIQKIKAAIEQETNQTRSAVVELVTVYGGKTYGIGSGGKWLSLCEVLSGGAEDMTTQLDESSSTAPVGSVDTLPQSPASSSSRNPQYSSPQAQGSVHSLPNSPSSPTLKDKVSRPLQRLKWNMTSSAVPGGCMYSWKPTVASEYITASMSNNGPILRSREYNMTTQFELLPSCTIGCDEKLFLVYYPKERSFWSVDTHHRKIIFTLDPRHAVMFGLLDSEKFEGKAESFSEEMAQVDNRSMIIADGLTDNQANLPMSVGESKEC